MEGWLNGTVWLILAALLGLSLVWWVRVRHRTGLPRLQGALIPRGVILRPQPLLTKSEATLYNLLQLAVQDHFLVFPQVPLWCLVDVSTPDLKARNALLSKIAFRRVDFALVHPGSLEVAKVVEINHQDQGFIQNRTRKEMVQGVLKAAGIEVLTLQAEETYAVPDLAKILGTATEE